jgi:heat shock protein 5
LFCSALSCLLRSDQWPHFLDADTLKPVLRVLADGKVAISEVDEIVLVGGSTRIPRVQQLVKEFFNGKEVGHGSQPPLLNVDIVRGEMRTVRREDVNVAHRPLVCCHQPSQGINPDEAVAYGAAVQGGLLGGESADLLVLDVNSLSVGIETVGGVMSTLIPRNKPVPNMKAQIFSTATDDQDTVTIRVFEGERAMTKDNNLLGKFDLRNIPRAPRGVPQIEVTFEIDVNGVLHVSAENKGAGGKGSITIANDQNRLSQEEIGRMLEEAERMDQIDKQLVARIGARNSLEGYLYGLKNQLNDEEKLGGHLSIDAATTVMEAVHGSLNWLGDNLDAEAAQFDDRRKQVEGIVGPIIAAGYTDSGHQFTHESDDTAGGDGEL